MLSIRSEYHLGIDIAIVGKSQGAIEKVYLRVKISIFTLTILFIPLKSKIKNYLHVYLTETTLPFVTKYHVIPTYLHYYKIPLEADQKQVV